ncbi:MAG: sugar phosphate isomerase/epimerase, partial [Firmicutes bacterium]|nr:sugar phosphate isomerase/epimerase [Bacillota bacterium]
LGISLHNVGVDYITKYNFKKVQLCHKFSGAKEITSLLKLNKKHPIKVVYHAPVFHQADPTSTYYLNSNSRLRNATFDILEVNLKMAQSLPTDYVIVHFTSKDIDEKIDDKGLLKLAKESLERLNDLSEKYNIPIYLEYNGYNDRFYDPDKWIDLIKDLNNLGICLDTGHLSIACKLHDMDYFKTLRKLLPRIKSMHLWNTRGLEDINKFGHIPVHPSQLKEDGWIDIEKTLKEVLYYNYDTSVVFEPDFKYRDKLYAKEGIDWINNMIYDIKGFRENSMEVK